MGDLEAEARRTLQSYVDAVRAKDVAALIALYDRDARVFDAWGVWSYEGAAAWEGAVRGWLGSLHEETVAVRWDDVRIAASGDLASVSAIVTYASVSPAGEVQQSMQNRLSWVLARRDGALRIVHEHTSAPIGMEDMKAILRRA